MARIEAKKVELAYGRIKELVVNARFRPGEQLQINELSEELDLSPTPVREALSRLLAEDLIVGVPNRGFFCKQLDVEELRALYEFAFVVLKHSLRFGLEAAKEERRFEEFRFDDDEITTGTPNQKDSHDLLARRIERLYVTIAALSRNPLMVSCIRGFNDKSHYMRVMDLSSEGHLGQIRPELTRLVSNLRAGKTADAVKQLDRLHQRKHENLPLLAREGLARAFLSNGAEYHGIANGEARL
ncbi:GntR family transcriptional regulator [Algihabitans albus]|uniref:GntR family transcriptional regulator n=1 Tax=Algihabitans albus TaxID=2164067 RepID=UPI0035CFE6B3